MPTLEARIATLERQNRALRASFIVSAIALVTCGGIVSNYERVNTNSLVIQDANEQAKITLSSNGNITFHGKTRAVLNAKVLSELLAKDEPPPAPK
ncbi:MAG: hypothetical protein AAF799_12865 [Myxococcota bacterium]